MAEGDSRSRKVVKSFPETCLPAQIRETGLSIDKPSIEMPKADTMTPADLLICAFLNTIISRYRAFYLPMALIGKGQKKTVPSLLMNPDTVF
jgi:hypothetical protein